jgi:hypothetical protein
MALSTLLKLLPIAKGFPLALPLVERRTNTGADLSLFLCPADRPPFSHEVAEGFDLFV